METRTICPKTNKHAFLIMAYNNTNQLKVLLSLLDHEDNDIYLHFDKKTKLKNTNDIGQVVKKSKLFWIKRICVSWGGYSQIRAELSLLREALQNGPYLYYHLLSGMDLPIKPMEEIHSYFVNNNGLNLISIDESTKSGFDAKQRIGEYHFLQDKIGRNKGKFIFLLERMEHLSLTFQKSLHINRYNNHYIIYKGSQWFSITDEMAQYVLNKEQTIKKLFRYGLCVDELFLQTLAMSSPYLETISIDTKRKIDWQRGRPYTWEKKDYQELINSEELFARKFDESIDKEIIDLIYEHINGCNSEL